MIFSPVFHHEKYSGEKNSMCETEQLFFFFQEENENLLSPWNWVRKKMSYEGEETEKWNWF